MESLCYRAFTSTPFPSPASDPISDPLSDPLSDPSQPNFLVATILPTYYYTTFTRRLVFEHRELGPAAKA
ncbi:hypothetical protein E6O75_ATG05673 [Venturia nashicola]|uniref:Uncharacterized protein n=1 Tax=Venturia nashicola TaxID=86259 RepID=A0A4Z1P114_9PEZI|nr:hypothetical protein E6O75_ATG05673 [Venturia nashicola]